MPYVSLHYVAYDLFISFWPFVTSHCSRNACNLFVLRRFHARLRVTTLRRIRPVYFVLAFCHIPLLVSHVSACTRLSGAPPSTHRNEAFFLRLAIAARRRPNIFPLSPAKTKNFLRLQAHLSITLRPGRSFPRPARRCVVGFLPIRLRPSQLPLSPRFSLLFFDPGR